MKRTLLNLTQNILSSLSSDEVNSISDSTESLQVAEIIKTKYFDIISRVDLPDHDQLIQLDPSLDNSSPVLMHVPDGVSEIHWIKYFNSNVIGDSGPGSSEHDTNVDLDPVSSTVTAPPPGYQYVTILPVQQFIEMVNGFNPETANVESFQYGGNINGYHGTYNFYFKNDRQPTYCCLLSNINLIFDSYDATQDDTLQASKSMAWGRVVPTFRMEDNFTPELDDEQVALLLNESKALAYFELKQAIHPLAQQEVKRGWSAVQKTKNVNKRPTDFDALPNFGRRGGYMSAPISYFKERGFDTY